MRSILRASAADLGFVRGAYQVPVADLRGVYQVPEADPSRTYRAPIAVTRRQRVINDNWTVTCLPTWHRVRRTFRCTNPITVLCCLIFCEILILQVGQLFNPVTVPLNITSLVTQTQHRARTVSLEVCTRCHDMVEILVDVLSFSQYSHYPHVDQSSLLDGWPTRSLLQANKCLTLRTFLLKQIMIS